MLLLLGIYSKVINKFSLQLNIVYFYTKIRVMKELKIKIRLGQFEVELEGDPNDVKYTLNDLKENGFGNMLGNSIISNQAIVISEDKETKQLSDSLSEARTMIDSPLLKDIVIRQLPKTEVEWIVLYAFYINGEKDSFSKEDIQEKYKESDRWSRSNTANFSKNFNQAYRNGYFTVLNDTDFLLTNSGNDLAIEIISRTESAQRNKRQARKSKGVGESKKSSKKIPSKNGSSAELKVIGELNLKPKDKVSLADFIEQYNHKSNLDKNLLFINYLSDVIKENNITYNHVFSCYRWLEIKFPDAFVQSIRDIKTKKGWLLSTKNGEIKLSPKGLNALLEMKK